MSFTYLLPPALIGGAIVVAIVTRRHQTADCIELVSRLHPYQMEGLDEIVSSGNIPPDIWTTSHGYLGLWRRWRNSTVLVQLAQVRGLMEDIPEYEIRELLAISSQVTRQSFVALVAGSLRLAMPDRARNATFRACSLYVNLAYKIYALYADDTAPLCANRLASML